MSVHYALAATTVAARALQGVELVCLVENLLAFATFYVSVGPVDLRCRLCSRWSWIRHHDEIPI